MSKTIDVLNKTFQSKSKIHDPIHEEIAKTYLKTSRGGKKKRASRIRWPQWLIALAAVLLVSFILILRSEIDIKVTISGKAPIGNIADRGRFFVKGGKIDTNVVRNASFLGDARNLTKVTDEALVLCNSRGSGWANYTIELKSPIDLTRFDIKYTARGARGDERLVLGIVDVDNKAYRMASDASSPLNRDWGAYTVDFKAVKNAVDLKNISAIRFEFGTLTAGNHPAATVFLKDIYIRKVRRSKWL